MNDVENVVFPCVLLTCYKKVLSKSQSRLKNLNARLKISTFYIRIM